MHKTIRDARSALKREGIGSALRVLNRSGRHRFTALYRFDEGMLRNLYLVDREDASVERSPDLPVMDSYCLYVRQSAERFVVDRSLTDTRVEGHPKQRVVQSYCGVPLFDGPELIGTVCHFDYDAIPISAEEAWMLDEIAPDLVEHVRSLAFDRTSVAPTA